MIFENNTFILTDRFAEQREKKLISKFQINNKLFAQKSIVK